MSSFFLRQALIVGALAGFTHSAGADIIHIQTQPGIGWLASSSTTLPTDWNQLSYDPSVHSADGWSEPVVLSGEEAIYPPTTHMNFVPEPHYMWLGDPSGYGPPDQIFMRLIVDLPLRASGTPYSALATINVDDDYEFFVNGVLINNTNDHSSSRADMTDRFFVELQGGDNVIAIHAVDGTWLQPGPLVVQRVMMDVQIIPEPASLALSLTALGLGLGWRRRAAATT
jgi:hypothetical protein